MRKVDEKKGSIIKLKEKASISHFRRERSKTGFEVEFLLVDGKGRVSNRADSVIRHIKDNSIANEVIRECCHSYIEMGVYPRIYVRNVATKFLGDMLSVLDVVEGLGLQIFPLAMYPYNYRPKMRCDGWYGLKKKIFGKKWEYAGRCAGFHLHYSLPKGIFSYEDRHLVKDALQSEKEKTLNSYNFAIAIDPALTAFTQSSPLFNGRFLGKDSRLLLYRGGKTLGYDGLYTDYPLFGALSGYIYSYEDLIDLVSMRHREWLRIVKSAGGDVTILENKNKLDFAWNPVKINKVGSIELRNMDMNMPSILMAVAVLVKYALRDIQREGLRVVPDILAIDEPFRFEDDTIYIPPFRHVSDRLQKGVALEGFENDLVYAYCKRFFALCLHFVNRKYYPVLKPIKEMLKGRKTVSDEIINMIKKRGHDCRGEVPEQILREIVLYYSGRLRRDINKTRRLMESLTEEERVWL